jgi:acyl-[acyl-carrier-protein]-phospholipid O-acyltransferase/long-chain-fatty-acid--[acyl-carrier-protein] ligase
MIQANMAAVIIAPSTLIFASVIALSCLALALLMFRDRTLRLAVWLLTHTIYRVRIVGGQNLPARGGALLVANHTSWIDVMLLMASSPRPVRFLMFDDIYRQPLIKPLARMVRAIPISPQLRPREMLQSLRTASEAIQNGEIVCIFAEGQITRIGQLLPFRRGMERIMRGVEAVIIPVHLDRTWGSIFSYERGRFLWKLPRAIPYRVTVSYGAPMPGSSSVQQVRTAVADLAADSYYLRRDRMQPLHRLFVHTARWHPRRFAMADARSPYVRFGTAFVKMIFLAGRLRLVWRNDERVAILLPPSCAGALVNIAASVMGKVVVNLNYTASHESIAESLKQCGISKVITSHAFLEKVPIKLPAESVLLEELGDNPRFREKLLALLLAWFAPVRLLERLLGRDKPPHLDDLATIIFSSGSTGQPKGVMLSHYNIVSNIDQMAQRFAIGPRDRFLSILPFFHAFGFTGTFWLPAALGIGVVFHPNPLDAQVVGTLVQKYNITFLLATPTFLQNYTRRCSAEQFGSLEYVLVGAEKLPERIAQAFEDKFGVRPLEGYGCTECGPVVAVNTPGFRAAGFHQVGAKRGTIGHPLPGVSVRLLHPATLQPVEIAEPGLLLVRGPNIMQGYFRLPEKTADVLRDGWYNTGDIASLDEDGFLSIAGRLSRFSKIGGEMVPHVKVEEKLQELLGATEQVMVVAGVPDEKKGERLVVLHTLADNDLQALLARLGEVDLPPLWRPRPNQFYRVEALPYLGTGKLDLQKLQQMAVQLSEPTMRVASHADS